MNLKLYPIFSVAAILLFASTVFSASLPVCVYISSYHKGYEWSDGIEASLREVLDGHCSFIQFNMDTKRNREESYILQKAKEAKELIVKSKPGVVITSDDNAAKYVIQKYFKESSIPFIFCGVNWTAKEYGFPYKNVTGIIEVTPVAALFELAALVSKGKRGLFIGDDTLTDRKDVGYFVKYARKNNFELEKILVNTVDEWKDHYLKAQKTKDYIILGHNSAIEGWKDDEMKEFILHNSSKLVLTTYQWMIPFSMVGLIIQAEEQGKWAGEAALGLLQGFPIKNIAIVANRSWTGWVNSRLIKAAGIVLPEEFVEKSQKLVVD